MSMLVFKGIQFLHLGVFGAFWEGNSLSFSLPFKGGDQPVTGRFETAMKVGQGNGIWAEVCQTQKMSLKRRYLVAHGR